MSLLSELVGEGGVAVRPVTHPPLQSEVEQKRVIIDEEELFSSDDDLCEEERQRDQRGQDRLWAAEGKTNVTKIEVVTQALIDAALSPSVQTNLFDRLASVLVLCVFVVRLLLSQRSHLED